MRKWSILLMVLAINVSAQDAAFRKVMAEVETMTPYAAVYHLQRYQKKQPTYAPVYLELGKRELALAEGLHPIGDYDELQTRLYNVGLYLGNYRHYSQKTNDAVDQQLAAARTWREQTVAVYESYFAMEERYNQCRHLFSDFLTRYPGEKNAHLLLTEEDRALTEQLMVQADSLTLDVTRYRNAVLSYGRGLIAPEVQYAAINLYRLDGLTSSDLMADTILMWDYAGWARRFIDEQEHVYGNYLNAIDRALRTELVSDTLINYIGRMDKATFVAEYMRIIAAEKVLLAEDTDSIGSLSWMQVLYEQDKNRRTAQQALAACRQQLNANEWRKYHRQFAAQGDSTSDLLMRHAEQRMARIEQAYADRCHRLYATLAPNLRLHAVYSNDLSGETVSVPDLNIPNEVLAGAGTVVELIPVDRDFMVVAEAGVIHTDQKDKLMTYALMPIYTAMKLSSNRIALIGDRLTVFVDREGNVIEN